MVNPLMFKVGNAAVSSANIVNAITVYVNDALALVYFLIAIANLEHVKR